MEERRYTISVVWGALTIVVVGAGFIIAWAVAYNWAERNSRK